LGHASVAFTLDTYSHVVPGLQEHAANRFDEALGEDVSKMLAADQDLDSDPQRTRTSNLLIKSPKPLVPFGARRCRQMSPPAQGRP
jgi:hypothetical protein